MNRTEPGTARDREPQETEMTKLYALFITLTAIRFLVMPVLAALAVFGYRVQDGFWPVKCDEG